MKSIWTTSESQAILPSTQKTSDLQELIGDPNHDQQKLQPTPEPSKKGIWQGFNGEAHNQSSRSRKNTFQNVHGQKAFKSKQQTPPQKTTSTLVSCPCHQQKKSKKIRLFQRIQAEVERVKTVQGALCRGDGKDPQIRSVWTFAFQRYKQKTFSIFFKCSCQHLKLEQTIFRGEEHS